jgi:hypothetical protein
MKKFNEWIKFREFGGFGVDPVASGSAKLQAGLRSLGKDKIWSGSLSLSPTYFNLSPQEIEALKMRGAVTDGTIEMAPLYRILTGR